MDIARKPFEEDFSTSENDIKIIKPKFDGVSGLRDLVLNELKSLYYVEKAILKTLPKVIKNACAYELIEATTIQQDKIKMQIARIEDSFLILNENPILQQSQAIDFLLQDIDSIIEETKFGVVRDAGIVLALQKIAHYEKATYSILAIYSENLHQNKIYDLLFASLNEEKITEMRLAKIANTIRFHSDEI